MEVTATEHTYQQRFSEEHARALFLLAGIEVLSIHELLNHYWPEVDAYREIREASPWFLVETSGGLIKIGWRKRVISIDWSRTDIRCVVTPEDVTKGNDHVHAWSYAKAVECLTVLSAHHGLN